jgi:hypothetical protein
VITKTLIDRFNAKYQVDTATGCWLWIASTAGAGYGQIKLPGQRKQIYAHRLSYLYHKGEIPDGQEVCHSCDTPRCVNPDHLFLGTSGDNHMDMKAKDRHTRGERNNQHKLTEREVEQMFDMAQAGLSTHRIAKAFGIGQMSAWRILNGKRWEHVYLRRRGSSGPA